RSSVHSVEVTTAWAVLRLLGRSALRAPVPLRGGNSCQALQGQGHAPLVSQLLPEDQALPVERTSARVVALLIGYKHSGSAPARNGDQRAAGRDQSTPQARAPPTWLLHALPPAASPSVTPRAWRSGGSAPSRTGRTPALRLPHEGYTLLGNGSRAVAVVARSSWLLFPLHAWRFAPRGAFLAHPEGFASSSSRSARDPAGGHSIGPAHYTASSMVAWTPRSSAARS